MSSGVVMAPVGCERAFERICHAQAARGEIIRHQLHGWWIGLQGEASLASCTQWLFVVHGRVWFLDPVHAGNSRGAEALLAAWLRSGADALADASGNFAFVALELRTGEIWLYQSPTGSCGLFRNTRGQLILASEARAASVAGRDAEAENCEHAVFDLDVLHRHVLDQLQSDESFLAGVRRVPCDALLRFNRSQQLLDQHSAVAVRRIAERASALPSLQGQAAVEALDQGLRKVLAAYPERGMLALSAGWDSRNLALRLDPAQRAHWSAVTLVLADGPDEYPVAADLAQALNLTATRLTVTADDLIADYLKMLRVIDAPVHVQSLGNWQLAGFAGASGTNTLIFGDGGDELFLFAPEQWRHAWRHPMQAVRALWSWLRRLPEFSRKPRHSVRRMLQGLFGADSSEFGQTGLLRKHLGFPWIGSFEPLYARQGVHPAYPYFDPVLIALSARLTPFARLLGGHPKGLMTALLNCAGMDLDPQQADPRPVRMPYRMVDRLRTELARQKQPAGALMQSLANLQQCAAAHPPDLGVSARLSCAIALLRGEC